MEYKIKDTIEFGNYWQDETLEDGKTPIKWLILDIQKNTMLLLSKYVLDNKMFSEKSLEVTWENSSIRKWLNNEETLSNSFINNAFNETEQKRLVDTNVLSEQNDFYCLGFGNDTNDKIFLLSLNDVFIKYFHSNSERIAYPTKYVISNNVLCKEGNVLEGNDYGVQWWLRNRGRSKDHVATILPNGYGSFCGLNAFNFSVFVRPALWIKI